MKRRAVIGSLLLFLPRLLVSQGHLAATIRFERTDSVPYYRADDSRQFAFIASKFASDEVQHLPQLDSISVFFISRIVLVYSDFRKVEKFDQTNLNSRRWQNLQKNYPSFFSNGLTKFQNVCQMGGREDSSAKKLAHGFYIYYENRGDPSVRAKEISEIDKMLEKLGINAGDTLETESLSSVPADTGEDPEGTEALAIKPLAAKKSRFKRPTRTIDPKMCRAPFYGGDREDLNDFIKEKVILTSRQLKKRHRKKLTAEVRLQLEYDGTIRYAYINSPDRKLMSQVGSAMSTMQPWHPAVKNGSTIRTEVRFRLRCSEAGKMELAGEVIVARNVAKCASLPDEEIFDFSANKTPEKLIPKVFEVGDEKLLRHVIERNPALDSLLIVIDLTGSMGPYIAQILDLMADLMVQNRPCVSCFSLFNDGNSKPDLLKRTGHTGGIIILDEELSMDKLGKAIMKSMRNGTGGDCPENNIEATIKAERECRHYKDILMVADNCATPRDGVLIAKVSRPMHWVLCSVGPEINTDYLNLVRENKGMLHTLNSDIGNLHLVKEGEIITIDGTDYKLEREGFRLY